VLFPLTLKEVLGLHTQRQRQQGTNYLFESIWKWPYSARGVRTILVHYSQAAGFAVPIAPHELRHFLLPWLKKRRIEATAIQPHSGRQPAVAGNLFAIGVKRYPA
jgi:integrase/recombinase XerD